MWYRNFLGGDLSDPRAPACQTMPRLGPSLDQYRAAQPGNKLPLSALPHVARLGLRALREFHRADQPGLVLPDVTVLARMDFFKKILLFS